MGEKDGKKLALNASRDFVFSVLALIIYNGVLQLIVYPGLNAGMGADAFGTVLYLISVISIMGAGFGTAASYSRMMAKKDRTQENGDYNLFLIMIAGVSVVVSLISLLLLDRLFLGNYIQLLLLMIITVVRYYADVEYRMTIRFVDYFLFFCSVSVGYCIGLAFYKSLGGISVRIPFIGNWSFALFLGEFFGIIYTIIRGKIFRPPFFRLSASFRENIRSVWLISASNLISALILNSDRILLRLMVGAREVTVFYTASLIGKIVAMLTTPLNGIIISYFTNYKIKLSKKIFTLIGAGMTVLSVFGALVCTVVSMLFVKMMYPDVFEQAKDYFFMANLGQILYFISGSLMVIVLSFTKEKLQLIINIFYVVVFFLIVIPLTYVWNLKGMAVGLIIVNFERLAFTAVLGIRNIRKEK
ncbi:MAG: hypothetical protein IJR29_08930 [Butyrivibrio sp.]|nr:hypothetical protein [Butyrivibrio sp.]